MVPTQRMVWKTISQEMQKILKKDNSCRWPTWVEERGLKFLKNNQHERTLKFGNSWRFFSTNKLGKIIFVRVIFYCN